MHLKSYAVDGGLLRTGSAKWSPTGLKRQDNDVPYETSLEQWTPLRDGLANFEIGQGTQAPRLHRQSRQAKAPALGWGLRVFLLALLVAGFQCGNALAKSGNLLVCGKLHLGPALADRG